MNKFTKKPITIEAVQWTGENITDVVAFCNVCYMKPVDGKEQLQISTLEGPMTASVGDYVIKGIKGEFYACKPDVFEMTYDQEGKEDKGEISDGYHTFNELYEFRKMYNAAAFNAWAKEGLYDVHKSKCHSDGLPCFNGGWFIVMAVLPSGQVSNHYRLEDWDLFQCPEELFVKYPYDGHTAQDVLTRLEEVCLIPNK